MKQILIAILALALSACSMPAPATLTPTSLSFEALSTAAPTVAPTGVLASPTVPASTPTAMASDLFSANFITPPTPICNGLTPEQTEGPYYKADSPEKNILFEQGMAGEKLILVGYVLDQNCQPIAHAWLDFWQADANGQYDNSGYTLRGHQFTDAQGRYFLETVVPGEYPGRTEHIHVKLQAPNGQVHTSQVYFPNVAGNSADQIFDPALIVTMEEREGYYVAYFNFVIAP